MTESWEPSAADIAQYRRDGFLVVENYLSRTEVAELREALDQVMLSAGPNGDLVVQPDTDNWKAGSDGLRHRFMSGVFRTDARLARFATMERHGAFAARLEGVESARLETD